MTQPKHRYLCGLPRGDAKASLSWRLCKEDPPDAPFHVERRAPSGEWQTITRQPVTDSTSILDQTPNAGEFEYRVKNKDGSVSETVCINTADPATVCAVDAPLKSPAKSYFHIAAGELLNDGRMGYVAPCRQEGQSHLDAYSPDGKFLWRKPTGYPNNVFLGHTSWPYLAWDINHDGRTEVVTCIAEDVWSAEIEQAKKDYPDSFWNGAPRRREEELPKGHFLCALDGETGEIVWKVPWPGKTYNAHMTLGYTRGMDQCPALIVHDGGPYKGSTIIAVDGKDGKVLWSEWQDRPTGHNIDVSDIDRDGIQEVIAGGLVRNGDGSVRWEAEPFGHTDISKADVIDPELDGFQIWFAVETKDNNPGVYLVDNKGKTIFKEKFGHAHYGWVARHDASIPGLQPHTAEDSRAEFGHGQEWANARRAEGHYPIFMPDGSHWGNLTDFQRKNFCPVHWDDGPEVAFAIRKENKRIVRLHKSGEMSDLPESKLPEGGSYGRNMLALDVVGDYRENIVTFDKERDRLMVLANPNVARHRGYSPNDHFEYRHDRSQHGSGYYIYLSPPNTIVNG